MITQSKAHEADGTSVASLMDRLEFWAEQRPCQTVYTFDGEDGSRQSLTYAQLVQEARRVAVSLRSVVKAGDCVLLHYPPGLEFITAFFGCVFAGVVAVPTCYPRPRRPTSRLLSIARDAQASAVLTTQQTCRQLESSVCDGPLSELPWHATDTFDRQLDRQWKRPDLAPDTVALIQYTSGSTSVPKGVVLSHGNLLQNLEAIRRGFNIHVSTDPTVPAQVGVFWLPAYHDMGLIGGILTPMYVGGHSHLMSPRSFIQRPLRWLSAIDHYQASISGAPNFAFDLCVDKTTPEQRAGLNLRSWRLAFCGAEPIRARTLERFADAFAEAGFRRESFYPCYGLAECALIAAGGSGPGLPVVKAIQREPLLENRVKAVNGDPAPSALRLVACGRAVWGQQIEIVDPVTRVPCVPGRVGEIWIKGPSNALGYWNRPRETSRTFGARLADSEDGPYLRTGDLGFRDEGQLYVTGRLKDVIILRGRNHYPQDIERTASEAHPALGGGHAGAAFSVDVDRQERLVVVHEVDRRHRGEDWPHVVELVRRAIVQRHEVDVQAIVLVRQASLPRTTSGKMQRQRCRKLYLGDELKVVHQWVRPSSQYRSSTGRHPTRQLIEMLTPHHNQPLSP